jgi:hypothetical protein
MPFPDAAMASEPSQVQTLSMTARDEILAALPAVRARTGRETFAPQEVIDELQRRGTSYKPSTIRTHIGRLIHAA